MQIYDDSLIPSAKELHSNMWDEESWNKDFAASSFCYPAGYFPDFFPAMADVPSPITSISNSVDCNNSETPQPGPSASGINLLHPIPDVDLNSKSIIQTKPAIVHACMYIGSTKDDHEITKSPAKGTC